MSDKLEFKAELRQLLHLITHSLYSNPEIFLRELVSNASDAINKIRFDSLAREELLEGDRDWKIRISVDRAAGTLTVSDNGIGMSRDEVIENLGTIAKSGTKAFLEALKARGGNAPTELIGQFGVGFYSSFMVADRVIVDTRPAGEPKNGTRWESDGRGEFTVEAVEKPRRGTDVTLHLKEDAKKYLNEWEIRQVVKKFSDFIEHPIVMEIENEKDGEKKFVEETLNTRKAIWLRNRNEVTAEEYNAFYKQIAHDDAEPAKVIHYTAEGANEFRVLMFIPAHRPLEMEWGEPKTGLRLYVQRVLIMERCEQLLPMYLRFVKGVVDSSDLPLNVSREILQHNPLLEIIQKNVVKNVLDGLTALKNTEYEKYVQLHLGLGHVLKEGLGQDWSNREKIADLVLFESVKTPKGQFTTLAQYIEAMPAEQKEIYYLIGESRELIENSPYLEAFKAKGFDVLLLTDPIDEFAIPALGSYKGKALRAADRGDLEAARGDEKAADEESFKNLLAFLKGKLEDVSDVRLSKRLTDSAACLVADHGAMTAHLERLMQRLGRGEPSAPKRVLELNPAHPAVAALCDLYTRDPQDARVESYGRLLLDQALLAEGSKLKDPSAFAKRVNDLLVRAAG
jgi:molecular chaperone HtpG